MDRAELARRWREGGIAYADAVNAYQERAAREGPSATAPDLPEEQTALADAVLEVVREANRVGEHALIRETFAPAWQPFVDRLEADGQPLTPVLWLDDERVAVGVGPLLDPRPTMIVSADTVVDGGDDIRGFGGSPAGDLIAVARDGGVEIRRRWEGPITATLPWPDRLVAWRDRVRSTARAMPSVTTRLLPLPDGRRALLAGPAGVFLASEAVAHRLLPTPDRIDDWTADGSSADDLELSMEHVALSPDGRFILAGDQDSAHLVFDAIGAPIAQLQPRSEYPCFALFSADGRVAAFNSCHMYWGETIGIDVRQLGRGASLSGADPRVIPLEDRSRVYAGVAHNDELIMGDAFGYVRAVDLRGGARWQVFIGSTISGMDLSPDGRKLAVSTHAGFLVVFDLEDAEDDPSAVGIGAGRPRELWRWIFWRTEQGPLRW